MEKFGRGILQKLSEEDREIFCAKLLKSEAEILYKDKERNKNLLERKATKDKKEDSYLLEQILTALKTQNPTTNEEKFVQQMLEKRILKICFLRKVNCFVKLKKFL